VTTNLVRQVRLRSGSTETTGWVPEKVRAGNSITLKDGEDQKRLWRVVWAGTELREPGSLNRGWDNNI
jgi:hypothetical protein